jgi:hypothetical protein
MFLSVNARHSQISGTASQGPTANVLQLSGSRSQTSGNASQEATMSKTFLCKSFFGSLRY